MDDSFIPFVSGGVNGYKSESDKNDVSRYSDGKDLQVRRNELMNRGRKIYSFGVLNFRSAYVSNDIEEDKWESLWKVLMRLSRKR